MMSPVLPLVAVFLAVYNVVAVALLSDFYVKRHRFNYRSRSPTLALCCGITNLALTDVALVNALLGSVCGGSLPLRVLLWANWLALPLYFMPYLLRALKMRVVFDANLRRKYSKFVTDQHLATILFSSICVATIAAVVATLFFDSYSKTAHYHTNGLHWLYKDAVVEILIVCIVLALAVTIGKCPRTEPAFDLRLEGAVNCAAWGLLGTAYVVLVRLDHNPEPRFEAVAIVLLVVMHATSLFATFVLPFHGQQVFRNSSDSRDSMIGMTNMFNKARNDRFSMTQYKQPPVGGGALHEWTPEGILEFPQTVDILMEVASKHRCPEIVAFASDAQAYSRRHARTRLDKLFAEYIQLIDTYIVPQSKLEINISQSCRDRLIEFTTKAKFAEQSESDRLLVFSAAYKEVLQAIQMNLLVPFHAHPKLKEFDREQRETIDLERSLTEAGLVDVRETDL